MLLYNMRLGWRSFRKAPGLTALMAGAIALGMAACIVTMTLYHAMSGNPIWWKNDRLFAVTLDNWSAERPFDPANPHLPPPQVTYRDAVNIARSDIPLRHVIMHTDRAVMTGGISQTRPISAVTRVTSADFFAMFDVPFLYGAGWDAAADRGAAPVLVLSKQENQVLFGGANSVGRTLRWNDIEFRVVGVLNEWRPRPKFYDLNGMPFSDPDDVYVPFGWTEARHELPKLGDHHCWRIEPANTFEDYLNDDCVWIQMWVELPDASRRERMQAFLDNYWAQQRKAGRFPRPRDNRLTPVSQWLVDNHVVHNDDRMLVILAFAFLTVCLINTVGLLLAKFLNGAALTGIRRALGASRRQIFAQHLVETGMLSALGTTLGLLLAALGLWAVRALYAVNAQLGDTSHQDLAHFDSASIVIAVTLAAASTLLAGLYPAWRIAKLPPATYLKSQ